MNIFISKKAILITVVCAAMVAAQTFAQKEHHEEKPQNLRVLSKNISEEELHTVMRNYSRALGVRCNHCHESEVIAGQEKPKYNFASDSKHAKDIAREMIEMTAKINSKYISKIGDGKLDQITCVTCHNGSAHPMTSVDSLKKK